MSHAQLAAAAVVLYLASTIAIGLRLFRADGPWVPARTAAI